MVDLEKSISVARKSGQTKLGMEVAIKAARLKEAKLIVVASNAPKEQKEDLLYYANLSEVPVIEYPKTSLDLGILCGRSHLTSAVTIINPGDSDILDVVN